MTNGPFSGGLHGRVDIDSAAAAAAAASAAAATTAATSTAASSAASLEGKRSSSRRYIFGQLQSVINHTVLELVSFDLL